MNVYIYAHTNMWLSALVCCEITIKHCNLKVPKFYKWYYHILKFMISNLFSKQQQFCCSILLILLLDDPGGNTSFPKFSGDWGRRVLSIRPAWTREQIKGWPGQLSEVLCAKGVVWGNRALGQRSIFLTSQLLLHGAITKQGIEGFILTYDSRRDESILWWGSPVYTSIKHCWSLRKQDRWD